MSTERTSPAPLTSTLSRRGLLGGMAASPIALTMGGTVLSAGGLFPGLAQAQTTLKISHQFPGGTLTEGDFRDRLCRKFAAQVEAETKGALKFEIYPASSLMKTVAQLQALRKGALDFTLYPMPYGGGEIPEMNLGLMPCLVTTYEQGLAWKKKPIGEALTKALEDKGVKILTWVWQAGGVAARGTPVVHPADVKGIKIRGGSREMDMMFKAAGAAVSSIPSNEIYAGMQTGALDAAVTSSTSLISFKLEEQSKSLTAARQKSFWYMLEPLMMSKMVFDSLPAAQQKALTTVGESLEPFGLEEAKKDDQRVAEIYAKAGVKVVDMDDKVMDEWRAIARDTAWKDFGERYPEGAKLLKLAEDVA
ncbi:TRAP transporter substrate-binding protein DctP [Nitrospirillum iridis]|uniref:TRAP-type C4-dicarboxylate transport system substrate-binding protein n=1 Tax=Nitrospirillum iridis TaxID=765888 RepID=A0A7X0AV58_9PROT|nr:TRAP transporter substrate-binding protein DctP [Nitrospirillum iridis]MBB6250655.1 TRAP-type C4-dicarboxylate transport system substrate-binding protein [Nitrospirillum iridis]